MDLADDLHEIAARAAAYSADGEDVEAIIATEPRPDERLYLCSFSAADGERQWLVLDAHGSPVESRERVREAVSIAALCEVAEDSAGGGDVADLRAQLLSLRMTENPPGIDEAEEAALALEAAIVRAPRVASPRYLDTIGAATQRLERTLGEERSPFATAMQAAAGAVEALTREVERAYKGPLS